MISAGASFAPDPSRNPSQPRRRLDPNAPAVDNIARVIGAGATARLISTFGGGRLYIAKNPRPADALARVLAPRLPIFLDLFSRGLQGKPGYADTLGRLLRALAADLGEAVDPDAPGSGRSGLTILGQAVTRLLVGPGMAFDTPISPSENRIQEGRPGSQYS